MARIAELDEQMSKVPVRSTAWTKLRKEKLAQVSRIKKRLFTSRQKDTIEQIDNIIKLALDTSLALIPA